MIGARSEVRAFGNLADIRGRPVIDRGVVVAMGSAGQIAAVDLRSGQRVWERRIGGSQTPWVAGRFLFVVTGSADVAAISRDNGKIKWVTPLTQYFDEKRRKPVLWGGPVLAGDRLLVVGTRATCSPSRPTPAKSSARSMCAIRSGSRRSSPIAPSTS